MDETVAMPTVRNYSPDEAEEEENNDSILNR